MRRFGFGSSLDFATPIASPPFRARFATLKISRDCDPLVHFHWETEPADALSE